MPTGKYIRTKEHNRKIANFRKGRRHSEITKLKISFSHKGKISPLRGRNLTEKHKKNISKANNKNKFIIKNCQFCNKKFETFIGRNAKFCSRKCVYKAGKHKLSKGNNGYIFKREKSIKCICKTCGKYFLLCQSKIKKGEGKFCSKECYAKELSLRKKGKNCIFYKNGLSYLTKTERNILYNTYQYKQWRRIIFIRDEFTCQDCGNKNIRIIAHHIKTWKDYPDLRFDINNGLTLCNNCHKKCHSPKLY